MYCTKCGQQFEGNFCPNCGTRAVNVNQTNNAQSTTSYQNPYSKSSQRQTKGWQPDFGNVQPIDPVVRQKANRRDRIAEICCIILTAVVFLCFVFGKGINTSPFWQDKDYPIDRVKALNSSLSKSELKNITSITPSVTNENEATMIAGEEEQISYLIVFDENKVSKITSKYGVLYENDKLNEDYFYWENKSNLEFEIKAEVYVKNFLKVPSSAKFSDLCICERETDKVTVKSSVTSENSFGVPVSNSYTAVIQQSPYKSKEYVLTYLKIGDEVMVES